jgi:hypothetical protein
MFFSMLLLFALVSSILTSTDAVSAPLKVLPSNPRYFTDDGVRAVYLTGSHTWNNFQDSGSPVAAIGDFNGFIDLLQQHGHNFTRFWTWEQAAWAPWTSDKIIFDPLPYERAGPGNALDGAAKFDLSRFNQAFFDRLRSRIITARDKGIYVGIVLFNGWSIGKKTGQPYNPWSGHPFNAANNINGINGDANGDGEGNELHTLSLPAVTAFQDAYVRKVIDTVNDLDNVLYEIANESHESSFAWQTRMVNLIRSYEAGKPKQHPVLMTSPYSYAYPNPSQLNTSLLQSNADGVAPNDAGGYFTDPPAATGVKVMINDTDHLCGICGDAAWVWKSFTRGLNPIFMDPMDDPRWEPAQIAMGQTADLAEGVNLAQMMPRPDLCSTTFCLANPGKQYIVYAPSGGTFQINLAGTSGTYVTQWLNPATGLSTVGTNISGGGNSSVTAPFNGHAVVILTQTVATAFNFTLASAANLTVAQGSSVSNTISAALSSGTSQPITLSATGLPQGATSSFSQSQCNPSCSSLVSINTATTTPNGTYPITVTGTASQLTKTTSFSLTVNSLTPTPLPPSSGATITLNYDGRLRDRVGQSEQALKQDGTLDGVFTVTLNAGSGNRTITRLHLTNTPGGVWNTVSGDGFWTLGAASGLDTALLNAANDAVNMALSDGGSFKIFASEYQNRMFDPSTTFTLAATFADGSTATAKTTINALPQAFNFTLASAANLTVAQGSSASNTISSALSSGTSQPITLSASGLPQDVTSSFSQSQCNPSCSSLLTINTATTTPNGTYPITVTGTAGQLTKTTSFSLTVSALPPSVSPPTVLPPPSTSGNVFYVAPNGTAAGNGSISNPWDLNTALSQPAAVTPGSTIWLRGGTYNGIYGVVLKGTAEKPIIVRQYPGERATINGHLFVSGSYVWLWGFEVKGPDSNRRSAIAVTWTPSDLIGGGIDVVGTDVYGGGVILGTGVKLINLVVHDGNNNGIAAWSSSQGTEIYGSLIYNSGWQGPDRPHAHGIYTQNKDADPVKRIADNFIFNNFDLGIQAYGSGDFANNYTLDGNIIFNNGAIAGELQYGVLTGAGGMANNITLLNNHLYNTLNGGSIAEFGYAYSFYILNDNLTLTNNYFTAGGVNFYKWRSINATGNKFYVSIVGEQSDPGDAKLNRSLNTVSPRPTSGVNVIVRPNVYEPGRANIVIYNWSKQPTVSVDASSVLSVGQSYEVRDAQNFFGAPVSSGTYNGGSISLPMTGLTVAAPVGNVPVVPEHTAPEFGTFILIGR